MYNGLTEKQQERLGDLKDKTNECAEALKEGIDRFNSEMRDLFETFIGSRETKLNRSIEKTNGFLQEVVDDATTERDDLDEDADSDEFERLTTFIDKYSSSELDEVAIDMPDDLSEDLPDDYLNQFDSLNELPETVDDSEDE